MAGPVLWLGGGSGAGKSVVARRLGREFGLRVYASDDVMAEHAQRTTAADSPLLSAFAAMDMDERWVRRGPRAMLETFHWFRGEGFDLIVEDLERLPGGVVVEGFRLLPRLVAPLLSGADRAVWLLPTPAFRRYAFEHRGSLWKIAGRTSDPQTALANLLERDRLFTDHLRAETARLGLPTVTVDGTLTEQALTDRVARVLGLGE